MLALETIAVIASLASFSAGIVMWYGAQVQKNYAAKRDFEHLKRNLAQLAEAQAVQDKEVDARLDSLMLELKDLKGIMMAILVNIPGAKVPNQPNQSP